MAAIDQKKRSRLLQRHLRERARRGTEEPPPLAWHRTSRPRRRRVERPPEHLPVARLVSVGHKSMGGPPPAAGCCMWPSRRPGWRSTRSPYCPRRLCSLQAAWGRWWVAVLAGVADLHVCCCRSCRRCLSSCADEAMPSESVVYKSHRERRVHCSSAMVRSSRA